MRNPDAIIVGAGPAGLACAATMRAAGLNVTVFEKADNVGSVVAAALRPPPSAHRSQPFRSARHGRCREPIRPIHRASRWSSISKAMRRASISGRFSIRRSRRIRRDGAQWCADTDRARSRRPLRSSRPASPMRHIVRPGRARRPIEAPSSTAANIAIPRPIAGKRVLVVGFGNSGGEIALDLANAGVDVALAVRGPVQILPRDLLGLPILTWAILYQPLAGAPGRFHQRADLAAGASVRIEKLGLRRAAKGPRQMVEEDGRVPMIDIGTLAKIRDGSIKVRGGIDRLTPDGVVFDDGSSEEFDAIILATGFRPDLRQLDPRCGGRVRRARHAARDRARRRTCPGFISAARSLHRRDSCARSASRRSGLPIARSGISRCREPKICRARSRRYPVRKCWRSSARASTAPTVSTRVPGLDGRSSGSNANPMTADCPAGVDTGQKSKREVSNG